MFGKDESQFLEKEINRLSAIGAIEKCLPCADQFLSSYFIRPKPNGKYKFILNLKKLNRFVSLEHFKLEDIKTAINLLSKNDHLASVDLQDAYFIIPVSIKDRIYLRFEYSGQIWQFTCLPFGLASAPYVFTKVMKPVISKLRASGFKSTIYLDDILILGSSYNSCLQNLNATLKLLKSLGFIINFDKSKLIPAEICKFLGFIIDSEFMKLILTLDRKNKIASLTDELLAKGKCSIADLAQIVGTLVAACPGVKYGWLYYKELERL